MMNLSANRRTWEEASSPAAVRLARRYEQAWRDSEPLGRKPDLREFLGSVDNVDGPGARLALLRADMALRWEAGEKLGAQWYLDRHGDLGEDTIVALIYEEFCLREEDQEKPDPADYLARFPKVAGALQRVLEIHELVGSATAPTTVSFTASPNGFETGAGGFPEAGETLAGFFLVEELGRGAFARVFLAREQQLADRPVALKVTRRGSREPQTLARLQHTHIVPVHSHRIDSATGLHLLCMPYFGRITLSRVLADPAVETAKSGAVLVAALDRLDSAGELRESRSATRLELSRRPYSRAIAWWGARLAEALTHAHDRGVLHRDIKPSNVLVTVDGMPMLLDFNLAREPVPQNGTPASPATLGGTIDYMAPEHLKALGEPASDFSDGRADIYSLGVVLYEAVTGRRPFVSPRRGSSVIEALLRAVEDRLAPLPSLCDQHPDVPPALDAVIRRCLQPLPVDRYQSAAELAADLQAVADDLPLRTAREPLPSRVAGWLRRRRRRLAMTSFILLAVTAIAGAVIAVLNEKAKSRALVWQEYQKGLNAFDNGEFPAAIIHMDAAIQRVERYSQDPWHHISQLRSFRDFGSMFFAKLEELESPKDLEEIKAHAQEKSQLAERIDQTRAAADTLFEVADVLRFRLHLGEGDELVGAFKDVQKALAPFYVLQSEDWTKLDHTLNLLDANRRERLLIEVNELLFLWVAQIDDFLDSSRIPLDNHTVRDGTDPAGSALAICSRALVWAEPKGPWLAMTARLKAHEARFAGRIVPPETNTANQIGRAPARSADENSALACFQWGLICLREQRNDRAMDWLRRATQVAQYARVKSSAYWYHYFLAYLEDNAGYKDEAQSNYGIALALKPDAPWVRFSRARLYRSKGRWDVALDDLKTSLRKLSGRPEAGKVHLELGYLYQELGDFPHARAEYDRVIAAGPDGPYAPAARLNRANIDAESGATDRARQEYDALIAEDLRDTSARFSRALLELREGQAQRAYIDCSALLEQRESLKNPDEVLAARALALVLLGRPDEAIADSSLAQRTRPSPPHERLRQRTLLAAHQLDTLQLDQPSELALFPVAGRRLTADLKATAGALDRLARTQRNVMFPASLNLAVILAALGENEAAVAAATRALQVSPYAPRVYLIRARIRFYGGDLDGARDDVDRGLGIQFNEPGLLELKGVLRMIAGNYKGALEDFDAAIVWGARDRIHLHRASALVSLGKVEPAIQEWSLALRRDPELPEAYLGRAQAHVRLRQWDMALADLEQAAAWARSDPWIELKTAAAYFQCLRERPDRLARCLVLATRAARDLWAVLAARPGETGRPR
jgi:serine/threonine protein kinase/Tfp pilus assembly protein PilF